jgi:hypothetical protein
MTATISLPDGYAGHTVECEADPIESDQTCSKLRVAGSPYLFRWVRTSELQRRLLAELCTSQPPSDIALPC